MGTLRRRGDRPLSKAARARSRSFVSLTQYDVVRLTTDHYRDRGVEIGALGTILEVYDDAYEVEFSRPDGITIDWFPVKQDEVVFFARMQVPSVVGPASSE